MKWKKSQICFIRLHAGGSVQYTALALNKCWMCVHIFSDNAIVIYFANEKRKKKILSQ